MLKINNLTIHIEHKVVLQNLNLNVERGAVHMLMGPNGSGKSSLAMAITGHPLYEKMSGNITIDGKNTNNLTPDQIAQQGLFLSFQSPVAIPGVSVFDLLRSAYNLKHNDNKLSIMSFNNLLSKKADELEISSTLLSREINQGFSGGEKKKMEILQMSILEPKYAILDEIDSGLDVDALGLISKTLKLILKKNNTGLILISHNSKLAECIKPDFVHIMKSGQIVKTGKKSLIKEIEKNGFSRFKS